MNVEIPDNARLALGQQLVEEFLWHFHGDEDYRSLAYHAALPLVLTPELLKFLRHEFLPHLSWVAEVDLLLSRLCAEAAEDVYVMQRDARAYLIKQMRQDATLGEARIEAVNRLLIDRLDYLVRNHPALLPQEWETQRLSAMLYVADQRNKAVLELSDSIYQCLTGAGGGKKAGAAHVKAELARLTRLVREAAETLQDKAYEELVHLARLTGKILADRSGQFVEQLRSTGELAQTYQLPGVAVSLPAELLVERIQLPAQSKGTQSKEDGIGVASTSETVTPIQPGSYPNDPWKGVFGGLSRRNSRQLKATVSQKTDTSSFQVKLQVRTIDQNNPLRGEVMFYLHPSLGEPRTVKPKSGLLAELSFEVQGAFTVGVWADRGRTLLELDLAKVPNASKVFREAKQTEITPELLFKEAESFAAQEKWADAENLYRRIIGLMPGDPTPWAKLAEIIKRGHYSQEAPRILIAGLKSDPNDLVRQTAALAMGISGLISDDFIEALKAALEDPSAHVRAAAAESLGKIGDKDSIDLLGALANAVYDEISRVRLKAVEAIGNLGNGNLRDMLWKGLRDEDQEVRRAAAAALKRLNEQEIETKRAKIFISFARENLQDAERIYLRLHNEGFDPWMYDFDGFSQDKDEIQEHQIRKAIRESDFFLACLSKHSISRKGVFSQEWHLASSQRNSVTGDSIFLIPLRLEQCVIPAELSAYHAVSLYVEKGWQLLLRTLQTEWQRRLKAKQPIQLTTFSFETLTLDAYGKEVKGSRRKLSAHQFVEDLGQDVTLEMVEIPGGKFLMGTSEKDKEREKKEIARYWDKGSSERQVNSELPQHEVSVESFYIGKFTITQQQWRMVAGWEKVERDLNPNPSNFKDRTDSDQRPVEQVSWEEAKEFCARLSKRTGRAYRLPTEAEWEYACRAGTTTPFAFGETITHDIVNYDSERPYAKAKKQSSRGETIPVGSLGVANAFGLFDMHGNVWEWCQDVWHDSYQGAPKYGSAWLSGGDSSVRVLRGGSWYNLGFDCRSAARNYTLPGDRGNQVGFRVVVSARTRNP